MKAFGVEGTNQGLVTTYKTCILQDLYTSQYIEDIQIFGMNMPFISSSEAKNAYFMSGEATNEIFIFSLHEMK